MISSKKRSIIEGLVLGELVDGLIEIIQVTTKR